MNRGDTGDSKLGKSVSSFPQPPVDSRLSLSTNTTGPLLPGAWEDSPAMEVEDPLLRLDSRTPLQSTERLSSHPDYSYGSNHEISSANMDIKQNEVVTHFPQIVVPESSEQDVYSNLNMGPRRKSEKGIVGVVSTTTDSRSPKGETDEKGSVVPPRKEGGAMDKDGGVQETSEKIQEKNKEGWVLVNVAPTPQGSPSVGSTDVTSTAAAIAARTAQAKEVPRPEPGTTHVPLSATQIIAAADAISVSNTPSTDPKELSNSSSGKSPKSPPLDEASSPNSARFSDKSTLGKIFSRRGGSGSQKSKSVEREEGKERDKSEVAEKDKVVFKKSGGVMSKIRSRKRLSAD